MRYTDSQRQAWLFFSPRFSLYEQLFLSPSVCFSVSFPELRVSRDLQTTWSDLFISCHLYLLYLRNTFHCLPPPHSLDPHQHEICLQCSYYSCFFKWHLIWGDNISVCIQAEVSQRLQQCFVRLHSRSAINAHKHCPFLPPVGCGVDIATSIASNQDLKPFGQGWSPCRLLPPKNEMQSGLQSSLPACLCPGSTREAYKLCPQVRKPSLCHKLPKGKISAGSRPVTLGTELKILLVIIAALQSTYIILVITSLFRSSDKRDVLCPRMFSLQIPDSTNHFSLNYSFYFGSERWLFTWVRAGRVRPFASLQNICCECGGLSIIHHNGA